MNSVWIGPCLKVTLQTSLTSVQGLGCRASDSGSGYSDFWFQDSEFRVLGHIPEMGSGLGFSVWDFSV